LGDTSRDATKNAHQHTQQEDSGDMQNWHKGSLPIVNHSDDAATVPSLLK
jgi:hypothetical protein